MRVVVTGGAGFIGSHLVERLVELGHDVTVLDDLSNGSPENLGAVQDRIVFVKHDVSIGPPPTREAADAFYHLACFPRSKSFGDPVRDVEVNVIGMVNVIERARKNKARIIFTSNSGIYDTRRLPISELAPDDPKTPYDLDKLQAENYLKLYGSTFGLGYVIFRLATVYGPRQNVTPEWTPVVMEFIQKLSKGQAPTIHWDGEQTRDLIFVDDVVDALILSLESEEADGQTMILGTGKETSINALYSIVCGVLGSNVEPLREPKKLGDIRRMRYECERARELLGWKAKVSVEEGIRRIVRHMGT